MGNAGFWNQFERSQCYVLNHCNCEAFSNGLVLQPMSVISSIPYLIIGAYVFWDSWNRLHFRAHYFQLALLFLFTGFGSIFNHSSYILAAELCDYGGVFMIFGWVAAMSRIDRAVGWKFVAEWAVPAILAVLALAIFYGSGRFIFAIVGSAATVQIVRSEMKTGHRKKNRKFLIQAISALSLGIFAHLLDMERIFCFDRYGLHGHSMWHLLSALSMLFIYRYFKSEEIFFSH